MASEPSDSQVYQRTRDTLGKIIKKPPLNDKYLSRPPFKFLRDIIMEVFKSTQFFKGLYSGKEIDYKAEWDREMKIAFLQKAIDVVVFATKKNVRARPSKIIAGAEADKTNEFLQLLGIAIMKKLDSSEAVQKVLKGEKPSQHTDKHKQKETKKQTEVKKQPEELEKAEAQDDEKENATGTGTGTPVLERPLNRPGSRRKTRENPPKQVTDDTEPTPKQKLDDGLTSEGSGSQIKLPERPTSAKGGRKGSHDKQEGPLDKGQEESTSVVTSEIAVVPQQQSPPPPPNGPAHNGLVSVNPRPSSARPPAPRVVKKVTKETDEAQSRMSSGTDRVPPNVILDREDDKDGDDEFVVSSAPLPPPTAGETELMEGQVTNTKPEGALAKTLLETKERYMGDQSSSSAPTKDVTIDEAQRKREREGVEKEVKTLQGSIQSLCQSANPLGKMMDYVQEDLDSMYQELEMWRKENATHAEALRREEKINEEELTPLQSQLTELAEQVIEQFELISNIKLAVMRNEQQMKNLVTSSY